MSQHDFDHQTHRLDGADGMEWQHQSSHSNSRIGSPPSFETPSFAFGDQAFADLQDMDESAATGHMNEVEIENWLREYLLEDFSDTSLSERQQGQGESLGSSTAEAFITSDASAQPICANALDNDTPIPPHTARFPVFSEIWSDDPMFWPRLAADFGLSEPPVEIQYKMLDGGFLSYWLPHQNEFDNWNVNDAKSFMNRFSDMGIVVEWDALEEYHDVAQNLAAPMPFESRPYNHIPTSPQPDEIPSQYHSTASTERRLSSQNPDRNGGEYYQAVVDHQESLHFEDITTAAQMLETQQSPQFEQPQVLQQAGNQSDHPVDTPPRPEHHQGPTSTNEEISVEQLGNTQSTEKPLGSARRETLLTTELADTLDDLVEAYSSEEARKAFMKQHDLTWMPPQDDITIPQDESSARECVRMLVHAMTSIKDAQDAENNNAFKLRWLPCKPGKPFYDTTKMVLQCWKIVNMTIQLHREGPSALQCFDHVYAKQFRATKDWTFEDRIITIRDLLATRKSRCDLVMRGEGLEGFVGAPGKMANRSKQNGISNGRKAKAIQRGMPLLKTDEEKQATESANTTPTSETTSSNADVHSSSDHADQTATQNVPQATAFTSKAGSVKKTMVSMTASQKQTVGTKRKLDTLADSRDEMSKRSKKQPVLRDTTAPKVPSTTIQNSLRTSKIPLVSQHISQTFATIPERANSGSLPTGTSNAPPRLSSAHSALSTISQPPVSALPLASTSGAPPPPSRKRPAEQVLENPISPKRTRAQTRKAAATKHPRPTR